jgi:uncharacterized protein
VPFARHSPGDAGRRGTASSSRSSRATGFSRASTSTTARRSPDGRRPALILPDVNILVYAYRADAPHHRAYRAWLEQEVASPAAFALSELVLGGFVRVVTHPRVFSPPSPPRHALAFCDALREQPNSVVVAPGERHWQIFRDVCEQSGARGNRVADAYLAALAIESGCEWITADRDYARFTALSWRHPLDA